MHRIKLLKLALGILFPFLLFGAENDSGQPLKLEAFSGAGSVLLHWELPEHETIRSTRIFRSNDMMSTYVEIILDGFTTDRYLDKNITSEDLLFYKLEIETNSGNTYSSTSQTPAFARPENIQFIAELSENLIPSYGKVISSMSEITDINGFNSKLIQDFIISRIHLELDRVEMLQMFLTMKDIEIASFLNNLTWHDFQVCALVFERNVVQDIQDFIDIAYHELEPIMRQNLLLTPKEWIQNREKFILITKDKFIEGLNIYKDDLTFLETLTEVRMTHMIRDQENSSISVTRFYDIDNHIELQWEDEKISVSLIDKQKTIPIPDHWKSVDLILGEEIVQSLPMIHESGVVTISLEDEYVFSDDEIELSLVRSFTKNEFALNEIAYNKTEKKLQVEVAGSSTLTHELGLFLSDSLIWQWTNGSGYEVMYDDSIWVISNNDRNKWLHLCQRTDDGSWIVIESRPIYLERSFHESKVPDLGKWAQLSFTSFGTSNDITSSKSNDQFIPEIFALYQNYPNPFNSYTKISFDLLEESTVNLYVADARGRKLHVFLEEIFLEKGSYSFDWSAEYQSSGLYFITLQAQSGEYLPVVMSRKMIYLK